MATKPRTREHFPKMKQCGRYRAYRAPRTNLFPGLEQFRKAMEAIPVQAQAAMVSFAAIARGMELARQAQDERARAAVLASATVAPLPAPNPRPWWKVWAR